MTPIRDMRRDVVREGAFASTERGVRPRSSTLPAMRQHGEEPPPRTFADILPPELITTSSLSNGAAPPSSSRFSSPRISRPSTGSESSSQTASAQRLVDAVRRSALPKMQGVVTDLRRSVTSMRRNKNKPSSSRFDIGAKQGTSGSYTRFGEEEEEENEGDEDEKAKEMLNRTVSSTTTSNSMGTLDRSDSAHRPTMSMDRTHF
ncbi:hypothetical protein M413DRAFT_445494 [Hebeloma cylindrosporum]|uniref:Uncharacterized protein n=1 Tax=Hebeloma cylindrosporum TaxID=76867 RepID=A0A0C2YKF1_HEBCY|nr:hypothetical protein M413DRAFT_445494 [Hebeloma cylindrosporum h7]